MPVLKNGELYLYGFVGDNYWGEGFTATEVIDALAEHGPGPVMVHINSGGGYTEDGIAIYNAFMAHPGDVTMFNDAMAASSASLIFMAGTERVQREGAMLMLHDPADWYGGTVDDHKKSIEMLDRLGGMMAGIYAARGDVDADTMRTEMKDTLWLSPDEAVSRGFATAANDDESLSISAFDYRIYAHAPQKLCALASEHQWSLKAALAKRGAASAEPETGRKGATALSKKPAAGNDPAEEAAAAEATAQTTETADAVATAVKVDRARRSEIMELDEAKGREALAETLFASDMSVEQIKTSLSAAPAGSGTDEDAVDPKAYEAERATANGLAQPAGGAAPTKAKIDRAGIFAARRNQMKGE